MECLPGTRCCTARPVSSVWPRSPPPVLSQAPHAGTSAAVSCRETATEAVVLQSQRSSEHPFLNVTSGW